jgi:hypothetical protein
MGRKADAVAEVFLTAFRSLPKADRDRILLGLVRDKALRRDLMDLTVTEARSRGASRPFADHLISVTARETLCSSRRRRLAAQAAKLDPKEERALAEEGL